MSACLGNIGYTPLHKAAEDGHAAVVKVLVDSGADENAITFRGFTPLQLATRMGRASVVEILRNAGALGAATDGASQVQAQNLRRWEQSGYPRKWVDDHHGEWNHSDWLDLLEKLKYSNFWPMEPDEIGRVLEEQKASLFGARNKTYHCVFDWQRNANPLSQRISDFHVVRNILGS